jgi:hypothetical protein
MAEVGDRVRMHAIKVDQPPREGVVISVSGSLLHIRWSTGEETTMVPGPGSVAVIGKVRKSAGKKVATPANAKATKSAKKP